MDQTMFEWALGFINVIGGILLKVIWDSLKNLREADRDLAKRVGEIEVLVAGSYIKRDEFSDFAKAIFAKLDKIDDKLNGKADR